MDTNKLLKIAMLLRKEASRLENVKQEKLASITLAASSLEMLRRKIYE
jgi:hypothetical protein